MTDPPSTEKASRPPDQPWQRFTLLEALLLQAAFAAGFSVVATLVWSSGVQPRPIEMVLLTVAGVVLGATLAGPIVLATHWLVRGRRESLSLGEWLWLAPSAVCTAMALLRLVFEILLPGAAAEALWAPVAVLVLALFQGCPLLSVGLAFASDTERGGRATCVWTDRSGIVLNVALGLLELLAIVAAMSFWVG